MLSDRSKRAPRWIGALTLATGLQACDSSGPVATREEPELSCSIPTEQILAGQRKDGIPALTDPDMLSGVHQGSPYPDFKDRVVGVVVEGEAIAVPLRVFWYHEIVNLDVGEAQIAITHCPLTGSSLVFDRASMGGVEFGVSGLLFQNNLIMYDRSQGEEESLWPQMIRGARCGDRDGQSLPMVPAMELTWEGWLALHPDSKVVSEETGYGFDYREYPYGDYDEPDNDQVLFPLSRAMDVRRLPKERALGIPDGDGGVVFPFGELDERARKAGNRAAVHGETSAGRFVVLFDRRRGGGMAYVPVLDGEPLTFVVDRDTIVDEETGSFWNVKGEATFGPLAGRRLEPIQDAFVAFWFSWPVFYPDLELWLES
jgi:hypothetical protein